MQKKGRPFDRPFLSALASRHEQARAVSGLRRGIRDGSAASDALTRGKGSAALDVLDNQVKRALRMRLDQLELREAELLVVLDVVAVLHFVQAEGRAFIVLFRRSSGDLRA